MMKETYADLAVIFDMMPKDMISKINPKFIEFVKEKAKGNYLSEIDPYKPLREQNLSPETEAALALIYESYLSD